MGKKYNSRSCSKRLSESSAKDNKIEESFQNVDIALISQRDATATAADVILNWNSVK
jgi:hypothetical protein